VLSNCSRVWIEPREWVNKQATSMAFEPTNVRFTVFTQESLPITLLALPNLPPLNVRYLNEAMRAVIKRVKAKFRDDMGFTKISRF